MTRFAGRALRVTPEQTQQMLLDADRKAKRTASWALVGGLVLCIGFPSFIWVLVWLIVPHKATLMLYGTLVIAIVPAMLIGAWFRTGNIIDKIAGEMDWDTRYHRFGAARQAAGEVFLLIIVIDILLLVGSIAVYGYRQMMALGELERVERARAAELMHALATSEQGKGFEETMRPGEVWEEYKRTVDYLLFHEMIGIAGKRKLVWLSTGAREKLGCPIIR